MEWKWHDEAMAKDAFVLHIDKSLGEPVLNLVTGARFVLGTGQFGWFLLVWVVTLFYLFSFVLASLWQVCQLLDLFTYCQMFIETYSASLPLFTFALLKASLQYLLLLTGFNNMSHVRHSLSKLHRAQCFLYLQGSQMDVIMWFHTAWLSGVVGGRGTVAHWGQRRGWQERFGQEWCGGCARDGIQRADHPQGCCARMGK